MNIALLGLGIVGLGVYELLESHPEFHLKYVMELDPSKTKDIKHLIPDSYDVILQDPDIDIIIELIGGIEPAVSFIRQALQHDKHVVTANKAVISTYYKELHDLANTHHVHLLYEASVGGGIIVLDPLKTIASVNNIHQIEGIVNGATNYVLTRIFHDGITREVALSEAFERGYLETGNNDDMDGLDAMRKIHILSTIAYQGYLSQTEVATVPLRSLTTALMEYVLAQGYSIKYLVSSTHQDDTVSMFVLPTVVHPEHEFARTHREWNQIKIAGKHHQSQTFIGQGAGRYPTASAVLYDLQKIQQNTVTSLSYSTSLRVDNDRIKHSFLIQTNDGFEVTQPMTLSTLLSRDTILCFAKWGVSE